MSHSKSSGSSRGSSSRRSAKHFGVFLSGIPAICGMLDPKLPHIGLEYIIELVGPPSHKDEPPLAFECALCDTTLRTMGAAAHHVLQYPHLMSYLKRHFPQSLDPMRPFMQQLSPIYWRFDNPHAKKAVRDLCKSIEERFGRERPAIVQYEIYMQDKRRIVRHIFDGPHFDEQEFVEGFINYTTTAAPGRCSVIVKKPSYNHNGGQRSSVDRDRKCHHKRKREESSDVESEDRYRSSRRHRHASDRQSYHSSKRYRRERSASRSPPPRIDKRRNSIRPTTKPPPVEPTTLLAVLRLLCAFEKLLGQNLGSRIIDLLSKSVALDKLQMPDDLLLNVENSVLLDTVKEKLKGLLLAGLVNNYMVTGVRMTIVHVDRLTRQIDSQTRAKLHCPGNDDISMRILQSCQSFSICPEMKALPVQIKSEPI